MSGSGDPFSRRAAVLLVAFGSLVFLAVLFLSAFDSSGETNDGGGHAGARGINGFAAFADLAERRGYRVRRSRSEAVFEQEGLLVLTPPHMADPRKIAEAIGSHRGSGPTIVVLPKWVGVEASRIPGITEAKDGWVILSGAIPPAWSDQVPALGALDVAIDELDSRRAGWRGFGRAGRLPDARAVQTLSSGRIVAMMRDARGQTAAGFLDDGTANADLEVAAGREPKADGSRAFGYPVIVVAEPDLLNNWGMASEKRAMAALSLLNAATGGERMPVNFDLTLNGLGRSANLLELAFTPPFLAATLCLVLAALVIGWRAFVRFGPPLRSERAIAFGKQALVANSAGLVLRARRLHLLGFPYVERARTRLVAALALPRTLGSAEADAAIDRAAGSRGEGEDAFSGAVARLLSAREPHQMVRAALDLHALERKLVR
jgi:hypothetical protein